MNTMMVEMIKEHADFTNYMTEIDEEIRLKQRSYTLIEQAKNEVISRVEKNKSGYVGFIKKNHRLYKKPIDEKSNGTMVFENTPYKASWQVDCVWGVEIGVGGCIIASAEGDCYGEEYYILQEKCHPDIFNRFSDWMEKLLKTREQK